MRGLLLERLCMANLLLVMILFLHGGDASTSGQLPISDHRQNRLSCLPCSEVECNKLKRKKCPWGFGPDPCKCCDVCAKAAGEPCGGLWNFGGTCGKGLKCKGDFPDGQEQGLGDTDGEYPWGKGLCTPIKKRKKRFCACGLPWKKVKNNNA